MPATRKPRRRRKIPTLMPKVVTASGAPLAPGQYTGHPKIRDGVPTLVINDADLANRPITCSKATSSTWADGGPQIGDTLTFDGKTYRCTDRGSHGPEPRVASERLHALLAELRKASTDALVHGDSADSESIYALALLRQFGLEGA